MEDAREGLRVAEGLGGKLLEGLVEVLEVVQMPGRLEVNERG